MVHVAMFVYGPLWPIAMGSQRVIVEIARYLSSLPDVRLKIVTISDVNHEDEYGKVCDDVVFIPPVGRWSFWNFLNKFVCRLGIDVWRVYFTSYAYRKQVRSALCGSDYIILNYAAWKGLLSKETIANRTIVITHDLMFYRRASFDKRHGFMSRFKLSINRLLEMRLLRKFNKVGVFADYERDILLQGGFPESSIVKLGMPISAICERGRKKEYDFIFVGGNSYQNEAGVECFFDRVAPLLKRDVSFAIAGGICDSNLWGKVKIPKNVKISRLGYVEDLSRTLASGLIGVGTVPYGSGIKVKVVESILSGLPMVLTSSGEEGVPVLKDAVVNIDREDKGEQMRKLNYWLNNKEVAIHVGRNAAYALDAVFNPAVALNGLKMYILNLRHR